MREARTAAPLLISPLDGPVQASRVGNRGHWLAKHPAWGEGMGTCMDAQAWTLVQGTRLSAEGRPSQLVGRRTIPFLSTPTAHPEVTRTRSGGAPVPVTRPYLHFHAGRRLRSTRRQALREVAATEQHGRKEEASHQIERDHERRAHGTCDGLLRRLLLD